MKMKLIESSIEQTLLRLNNVVSATFEQHLSPVIKEFDRAADRGIEKGVPMAYIPVDDIKHNKTERRWFDRQQKYYLGSYYAAIMSIFSNLSEEHHQRLGNRFNPKKEPELGKEPDEDFDRRYKAHNEETSTDLEFKLERNAAQDWVLLKNSYANHLKKNYRDERYGYSLNKDVEDNMPLLPSSSAMLKEYLKRKEDLEQSQTSLPGLLESLEGSIKGLNRGKSHLTDLDKLVLISQLSAPRAELDDKNAVDYITKHREMTQQFVHLQDYLKSDDVVKAFLDNLKQKEASLSSDQYDLIVESMKGEKKICVWEHLLPQNNEIPQDNVLLTVFKGRPEEAGYVTIQLLKFANKKLKLLKKTVERRADGKPEKRIKPDLSS